MSGCSNSPHQPHASRTYLGSHQPTVLSPSSNALPAVCNTDEISSHLLQKPLQTESAGSHDQIIQLASQIHSPPRVHENEQIYGFQHSWGGGPYTSLRQRMSASSLLCTFLTSAGWGKSPLPFKLHSSVIHSMSPPTLAAHTWITRHIKQWVFTRQLNCRIII